MSTTIKPELSKRNKWWIPKDRYYELLYFVRQYSFYKRQIDEIIWATSHQDVYDPNYISDPTFEKASKIEMYQNYVNLIETAAREADSDIWEYIVKGVAYNRNYTYLNTILGMPACRDTYYDRYRKFFYILNLSRK